MSAASPGPGFQEHLQKGLSLYKAGRWDEAVLALREAVLADPAAAEARRFLGLALAASHYNLGIRLEAKGLYGEAIAAFERFLTLAPTDAQRQVEAVRKRVAELRLLAAQRAPAARQETKAGPDIGWEPGNVIDGLYEVKSQLGVGGFGSVHKVYHRGWGLDLAVKSPRADRVSNRRALERFVQEANTWVGLGLHPHIVACFFVRLMGVPRIFIEY
ncbi:MAG: tetratricopeptide repeat protein, partial [Elusimicrobia bacterium]|nr:tetratricopeptide repeat protein [Elusimicrobiota bacterium]